MYRLSHHAQVERQERLFAIIDTVGFGKEVDKQEQFKIEEGDYPF